MISAIQKEWIEASGDPDGPIAEEVMHRAQLLARAVVTGSVGQLLAGSSVVEYLDAVWVEMHPSVKPSINALVTALEQSADA